MYLNCRVYGCITVLLLFAFILGCGRVNHHPNFNKYQGEIRFSGNVVLSSFVDSLFNKFFREASCKTCTYEIYFDKKDPSEYRITMTAISPRKDYLSVNKPVNYFVFHDSIPVFIYTGIEDFVKINDYSLSIPSYKTKTNYRGISWSFVYTKDSSYIVKNDWHPFMKLTLKPAVNFILPKK